MIRRSSRRLRKRRPRKRGGSNRYMRDDEGVDLHETVEHQLGIDRLGSRAAYQDMLDYIGTLADDHLAELLTFAVQGRGAFHRFKDVLANRTGTLEPYFAFAEARKQQRAAEWLAERGYVSTHTAPPRGNCTHSAP